MNGSSAWRTRAAARATAVAHAQFVEMDVDNAYKYLIQTRTECLIITSRTIDAGQKYQHLTCGVVRCLLVIWLFVSNKVILKKFLIFGTVLSLIEIIG